MTAMFIESFRDQIIRSTVKVANQKDKPVYFYMANLGSEVERIFVWKEKGDRTLMINAYNRAEKIINGIIDRKLSESATKELLMLKNVLTDLKNDVVGISRAEFASYFYPFARRVLKLNLK